MNSEEPTFMEDKTPLFLMWSGTVVSYVASQADGLVARITGEEVASLMPFVSMFAGLAAFVYSCMKIYDWIECRTKRNRKGSCDS